MSGGDCRDSRRGSAWAAARRAARFAVAAALAACAGALAPAAARGETENVAVVVEHDLYASGAIAGGLGQYLADVALQGYSPLLTTSFTSTSDPADLRAYLADQYAAGGLAGAVFIGHLPVQNVYTAPGGGISGEFHPCDLFYTDLDGSWTSSGAHGVLPDTHTAGSGDLGPEIWMGRLTAWNLTSLGTGRTEASLLNDYFAKDHAYRTGLLTAPRTGLAYTDDDWDHVARDAALALAVEGTVTGVWNDPDTPQDETTAADYKSRLATESYEHVLLSAHSAATTHTISGTVRSSDLSALEPQNLFYNLFACEAADYTQFGYIAGEYVFGAGSGLLAVGTTKTGGMMSNTMPDYFAPLGEGATFGQAMLSWWNTAVDPYGHTDIERAWYYGMNAVGDPLLVTQPYVSPPEMFAWNGSAGSWGDKRWLFDGHYYSPNGGEAMVVESGRVDVDQSFVDQSAAASLAVDGGMVDVSASGELEIKGSVMVAEAAMLVVDGRLSAWTDVTIDGALAGGGTIEAPSVILLGTLSPGGPDDLPAWIAAHGLVEPPPSAAVPEPSTLALLGIAGLALLTVRRRKR